MNILFLHGWRSRPGGVKPTFLRTHGYHVINPALDDDDFQAAIDAAQTAYNHAIPDIIIGSSRGGAVAMHLQSYTTPLILLCPAWRHCGWMERTKAETWILHSPQDADVPYADSEKLVQHSDLPATRLITTGVDHRLIDADSLALLQSLCEQLSASQP